MKSKSDRKIVEFEKSVKVIKDKKSTYKRRVFELENEL